MYVTFLVVCKCREFRVICPLLVRMVQNLRHSLYYPGVHCFTSRLQAMGADSVNFTWFARTMCEFSEICVIRSNCVEFSADGQESESMWMNFVANFV